MPLKIGMKRLKNMILLVKSNFMKYMMQITKSFEDFPIFLSIDMIVTILFLELVELKKRENMNSGNNDNQSAVKFFYWKILWNFYC